jgi:hypothetical protein
MRIQGHHVLSDLIDTFLSSGLKPIAESTARFPEIHDLPSHCSLLRNDLSVL